MSDLRNSPRLPGEPSDTLLASAEISEAHRRKYEQWGPYADSTNPLFTSFRYSTVSGIGAQDGVTRRDPSTVLRIAGRYYVWYTRRQTDRTIREGLSRLADQDWWTPVADWDLAEIWCATSTDGFSWREEGRAVAAGPHGGYDERSVFTPDVLAFGDRYYLYYQCVDFPYVGRTRNSIGMSWANSPDGPWHRSATPVLTPGAPGEWEHPSGDDQRVRRFGAWDSHKVHDPFALVRGGQVWLYYKGQPMGWQMKRSGGIAWGVAIAPRPEGPFKKSPVNPVTNSGHETCLFPWGAGIAAIIGHDGPEKDTVQYARDGLNFQVASHVVLPPCAAGPFSVDKCASTTNGVGITWGLSHIAREETRREHSYLVRFDCNLHRDAKRDGFRTANQRFVEDVYFSPDTAAAEEMIAWHESDEGKAVDRWEGTDGAVPGSAEKEATSTRVPARARDEIDEPVNPIESRPGGEISEATKRVYDVYGPFKDATSEFFSAFKYYPVTGVGREPNVTRRDPTKVIRVGSIYYVWYTRRSGPEPVGFDAATDTIPVWDWDLADIWYATSENGVDWTERGPAVVRGPAGAFDDRSVLTPDVLEWGGKYYLYYQVLKGPYRRRSLYQIGMSWADSPDGPWNRWPKVMIRVGEPPELVGEQDDPDAVSRFGAWDSHKLHDPFVIVRDGRVWLYYKGVPFGRHYRNDLGCAWGVATADRPEGPFVKSTLNPITNSGHETFLYPFRAGVVAITSLEGPEKNTVQYAPDGLNFRVVGKVSVPPVAAGPYVPDAFSDTRTGRGVTWGLSHIGMERPNDTGLLNSFLVRFECNLSREVDRPGFFRSWNFRFPQAAYFARQFALTDEGRAKAVQLATTLDRDSIVYRPSTKRYVDN